MQFLSGLLLCSTLVSAAPRIFGTPNAINQISRRGAFVQDVSRMSTAQVVGLVSKPTCWGGSIPWPQNDLPLPVEDKPIKQLSIFKRPDTTANTLTIHNYCDYDIHYLHLGSNLNQQDVLKAGATYTSPLSGTVWKASKSTDFSKVVLVEYNVAGDGNLWYNLSLMKCLATKNGMYTTDTSACAGHEAGLQLGNTQNRSYQCAAGTWCDDQAYLYDENLCKSQNPVTMCKPEYGITMEFCASNKK